MTKEERCVEWMRDVIEVHMDMEYGKRPTEGEHLEAIEDAEYVIDCIEKQIPKPRGWDKCDGEYICPHCGKPLLFDFDQVYCHRCGGALSEVE